MLRYCIIQISIALELEYADFHLESLAHWVAIQTPCCDIQSETGKPELISWVHAVPYIRPSELIGGTSYEPGVLCL